MQFRINIPPATRALLCVLIVISVAHQLTRQFVGGGQGEFFALIPQLTIFYPWVYITATFAEQNLITLSIAGATVLYGGKYLERAWGSMEFAKFILLVTLAPNIAATIIYVAWYAITRDYNRA